MTPEAKAAIEAAAREVTGYRPGEAMPPEAEARMRADMAIIERHCGPLMECEQEEHCTPDYCICIVRPCPAKERHENGHDLMEQGKIIHDLRAQLAAAIDGTWVKDLHDQIEQQEHDGELAEAYVKKLRAQVETLTLEREDALSYAAEVAQGVAHHSGCLGLDDPTQAPCCRCRAEAAEAREREALAEVEQLAALRLSEFKEYRDRVVKAEAALAALHEKRG